MRIKSVRWEQLSSGPGYENRKACAEVEVNEGDDPAAAMAVAKKLVRAALGEGDGAAASPVTSAELARIRELAAQLHSAIENASLPF